MLILCSDASEIGNYNTFSLLLLYLEKSSSSTFSCIFVDRMVVSSQLAHKWIRSLDVGIRLFFNYGFKITICYRVFQNCIELNKSWTKSIISPS